MKNSQATVLMPFLGKGIGGSHISGVILAKALQETLGFSCIIVAPSGAAVLDLANEYGISTIISGDRPTSRRYEFHKAITEYPRQARILQSLGTNTIVHCNDLSTLLRWGPTARKIGRLTILHDRAAERAFPKKFICRIAHHVIAISKFCEDRLDYVTPDKKTRVMDPFNIDIPADPKALRAAILAEIGASADNTLIGFSGNMWHRKRPEFFLQVAAAMCRTSNKLSFVMFGREGELSLDDLDALIIKYGLEGKCLVAGFRTPAELNIASLDVLLAPAVREPLGRTPVEAALLGVPYVITNDSGHVEIITDCGGGVGVPIDASPEVFASEVFSVLENRDRVILSESEKAALTSYISPQSHARIVAEIYKEASLRVRHLDLRINSLTPEAQPGFS